MREGVDPVPPPPSGGAYLCTDCRGAAVMSGQRVLIGSRPCVSWVRAPWTFARVWSGHVVRVRNSSFVFWAHIVGFGPFVYDPGTSINPTIELMKKIQVIVARIIIVTLL